MSVIYAADQWAGTRNKKTQNEKGEEVHLPNKNLLLLDEDVLYHLGLSNKMSRLSSFSDTRFVCMGGSAHRVRQFAVRAADFLGIEIPLGQEICEIGKTERYSLFKIGPIVSVNHGMGMPSMSILLHEVTKLMHYSNAKDVTFMRIGTSGGIGIEPGTVVVATHAVNQKFEASFKHYVLGKKVSYPTDLNIELAQKAVDCGKEDAERNWKELNCILGKTMGLNDFYEEQGRTDGVFCDYNEELSHNWLKDAYKAGIRNLEMEGPIFAAFCKRASIKALLINTVLVNRLEQDQIKYSAETLAEFSLHSQTLCLRYIYKCLREE